MEMRPRRWFAVVDEGGFGQIDHLLQENKTPSCSGARTFVAICSDGPLLGILSVGSGKNRCG